MLLTLFAIYCTVTSLLFGTACPISIVTGFPCFACGMTRANILALTLHFSEALVMHPLFFTSYIVLAAAIVFTAKPNLQNALGVKIACYILIAAFIGVYIYRMVAFYPNVEPMVYNYNSLFGLIRRAFGF